MHRKILVIRFSSIGDIVLTTPVLRALKEQLPSAEVHYVTKAVFAEILEANHYIDKLHAFRQDVHEVYASLKKENFDLLIDLHHNLRSLRLKRHLKVKSLSFDKLNIRKFFAVQFKMTGLLPPLHIVDRYFDTLKPLGVKNDGKGLDYFLRKGDQVDTARTFFGGNATGFTALVVGGSYYTKKIPLKKLQEICENIRQPIIALGDQSDAAIADSLARQFPHLINACGQYSIGQSASIISQAQLVISSDTGLMHIAAAFKKRIVSLWGNTIPEFGMSPYLPGEGSLELEVRGLSCRPCSKLGYRECPKGHFRCMMDIDVSRISDSPH